jgi:EmrB/QacA subfamily drug resistance transporter
MTVLDVAIVNVALPAMQDDLDLAQGSLQWVVSAYALTYAGFLLLGGRAADVLGRRRMLVAGIALFAVGSLAAGLAWDGGTLIGARALQGLGAAVLSPAALALLTTTFPEQRERNLALGVWGAVGGIGAAAGVLLGGLFTDLVGWEWIFFVNLPVAAAAALLAPSLLDEHRAQRPGGFDLAGAALVTAGLTLAVLAITKAESGGFAAPGTVGLLAVAAAVLAAFVAVERRVAGPLLSFAVLRRTGGPNVVGLLHGMGPFATFLVLTLYMQEVLGYSAMKTGVAYLAVAGTSAVTANVASRLVTAIGVRPVLVAGRILIAVALVSFTRIPLHGAYARDLLPGLVLLGVGMPLAYVSISIAALSRLEQHDAGVGSALVSTAQQIGGALGIAILSAVATGRTHTAELDGEAHVPALLGGLHAALWVGVAIAVVGVVASLVLVRDGRSRADRRVRFPALEVRTPALRAPGLRA